MKKLICFLMICWIYRLDAQLPSIEKNVMASGGEVTYGIGENIALTVGQNFIGLSQNSDGLAGIGFWYCAADFMTSVDFVSDADLSTEVLLLQNYPNPFDQYTNIEFSINKRSNVKLNVIDLNGRLIENIIDESMATGVYKVSYNPHKLTAGLYIYELIVNKQKHSKRMIYTSNY